jgi:hypothetical protein
MSRRIGTAVSVGLLLATAGGLMAAQEKRASPHEEVTATVSGKKITISYGRPSKKGREIFGALVPWAKPGQPYDGAVFLIKADRILNLVRDFDGNKLGARLEKFCRALYTARYGAISDEKAYLQWRAGQEQKSRTDIERLLLAWAELRIVLEMAAVNQMALGVIVYG